MKIINWLTVCVVALGLTYLVVTHNRKPEPDQKTHTEPRVVNRTLVHEPDAPVMSDLSSNSQSFLGQPLPKTSQGSQADACDQSCVNLLEQLRQGISLSKRDYMRLTQDMSALVAYLSNNPDVVKAFAIQSFTSLAEEGEASEPIMHILRQVPMSILFHAASELVFADDKQNRLAGVKLIDLAYGISANEASYVHKQELRNTLESVIYTESDLENKMHTFEILANHEWKSIDQHHLSELSGVFDKGSNEELRARSLEVVAMFGGQVSGFEEALISTLHSQSSHRKHALSAVQNLGVFLDKNQQTQVAMLDRLKPELEKLIAHEPQGSYIAHRAKSLLKQYFYAD